jgi:predicted flap endonuclease-1-like 5' DNA nuclease
MSVVIALIVGLVVGLLVAWFYWRGRISDSAVETRRLKASIADNQRKEQNLRASLQEQEINVDRLKGELKQREETILNLNSQIQGGEAKVKQLETTLSERDDQIQALSLRVEGAEAKTAELEALLREIELEATAAQVAERITEVDLETPRLDNLKRIEGIGPKISRVLNDAGITNFPQLAATDVSRLEQILLDAGMTLAHPDTWPEQAKLAAAGEWKALEVLQDELQGGRRVLRPR